MSISHFKQIGVVVIGRNEGDRLVKCLKSIQNTTDAIVYVDSASVDNSVLNAHNLGVNVLNLNMQLPFTAARARNAGFEHLLALYPEIAFVQFVDGDCEVADGWVSIAVDFLNTHKEFAIVCGRRRERFPDRSVYNFQCDLEWNTSVGEAKACGGDFLARADHFKAVGGFNDQLIAGEEPELCVRLRKAGWKIQRVNADMTWHDANILRFGQWWKRNVRAGHAYAEGYALHGTKPEQHKKKELLRALLWGGMLPFSFLAIGLLLCWSAAALLMLIYLLQFFRLRTRVTGHIFANRLTLLMLLAKFAELQGVLLFGKNRLFGSKAKIIEYK